MSTSSSDPASPRAKTRDRLPEGPWLRTWLVAGLLLLLVVGSYEAALRSHDRETQFENSPEWWALARAEVDGLDASSVVIVGGSRSRYGVDPAALSGRLDAPVVQLSIDGGTGLSLLEHLATEAEFEGLVICQINPLLTFTRDPIINRGGDAKAAYARLGVGDRLDLELRRRVRERIVLAAPDHAPVSVALGTAENPFTTPASLTRIRSDRFIEVRPDHYRGEVDAFYRQYGQVSLDPAALGRDVARWIETIQARGGDVLLLRMPSSGKVRQVERERWPRVAYWQPFVDAIPQTRAVHFEDHPRLREFQCPDGSHLSTADAAAFSRALADLVRDRDPKRFPTSTAR